ncbi:MAG TPA: hypothetical protein VM734_20135, partial [Kofleriaceae bacterium]|nr:hypothetical protein [Kofleriaceae bacterium]
MGRDALGTRPFRILLAIVVVAAGLAAAGLVALDDLPRWVRPLVLGASVVLAAGDPALQGLLGAAFEEAGWPEDGIPTPAELTDAQRALAEVVASAPGLPLHRWA